MIKSFFAWWKAELASLVQGSDIQSDVNGQATLGLKLENGSFSFTDRNNTILLKKEESLSVAHIEQVRDVLNQAHKSQEEVSLSVDIDSKNVLMRKINLPASTQENLIDVVKYEMDRYTPFKADDVYFDCRIEEKIKDKNLIKVLLLVINKKVLAPIASLMENKELVVSKVNVIDSALKNESIHDVKFLCGSDNVNNKTSITRKLAYLTSGLILLTSLTPLAINYIKINQLKSELTTLEPTISEVKNLQTEYQKMQQKVGYLIKIKESNISITHLLNLLSKTIPDNTFVQRMSYNEGSLSLQGLSASASDLIPIMDETGLFDDIRFVAPIIQNNSEGLERYSITARLVFSGVE